MGSYHRRVPPGSPASLAHERLCSLRRHGEIFPLPTPGHGPTRPSAGAPAYVRQRFRRKRARYRLGLEVIGSLNRLATSRVCPTAHLGTPNFGTRGPSLPQSSAPVRISTCIDAIGGPPSTWPRRSRYRSFLQPGLSTVENPHILPSTTWII